MNTETNTATGTDAGQPPAPGNKEGKKDMNTETKTATGGDASQSKTPKNERIETYLIPFSQIEVSKWNRSCGVPIDSDYIGKLAKDIKRNGLMHPVTLVKTADGSGYRIVAGANRVAALKTLRGDNAGVKQTEVKVLDDMTEDDESCLGISMAENHHRRASSVMETAVYVDRLIKEQGVDQSKLGHMLELDRTKINRLQSLAVNFGALPESWRSDLNTSPKKVAASSGTVITFGHWCEIAGYFRDNAATTVFSTFLDKAHDEQWSTRMLRDEIRLAVEKKPDASEPGLAEAPGAKPKSSPKVNSVRVLKDASTALRTVAGSMESSRAEDAAELVKHADAIDVIQAKLAVIQKESMVAEEAVKAARAELEKAKNALKAKKEAETKAAAATNEATLLTKKAQEKAEAEAAKLAETIKAA